MTVDAELIESQRQRRTGLRIAALFPPLLLLVMGALLVLSAPLSWGAGSIIDLPDWMPPAVGLFVGLGTLWVGGFAVKHMLRATRGDFGVFWLQTIFGAVMFFAAALMLSSLLFRLPDEATYRAALDEDGQNNVNVTAAFVISLVYVGVQIGWIWVGAYLYSQAFTNQRPTRLSLRRSDEVDGIGEMLRERQ